MRWRNSRRSTNVEDRRGRSGMARTGVKVGGGLGGLGIIVVVVMVLLGGDPMQLLGMLVGSGPQVSQTGAPDGSYQGTPAEDEQAEFVHYVLGDTEDVWNTLFSQHGSRYQEPNLVLFSQQVNSPCGMNTAATGPFYCPGDRKVYLDLSFFTALNRMGAPGDFARAYVIGHEVAHHVQNLTGLFRSVRAMQSRASQAQANALQVLVELQADCYAGVWAHHAHRQRQLLEEGDIDEGLQAAAAIGDDTLQRNAGRRVQPDSFTHGTSAQRVHWFRTGLAQGSIEACDTFADAGVRLQ